MPTNLNPLRFSNSYQEVRQLRNKVGEWLKERDIEFSFYRRRKVRKIIVAELGAIIWMKPHPDQSKKMITAKLIRDYNRNNVVEHKQKYGKAGALTEDVIEWLKGKHENTNTAR